MTSAWAQLLANFAVVAMFVSVWIHTHVWVDRLGARTSSAAFGLLMGMAAIVVMSLPVKLMPGVMIDLRFVTIALSGLFGGPVAGLITGVMAGAFRIHEGGAGAFAGTISVLAAMIVTTAGHQLLRGRPPMRRDILIIAATVAIASRIGLVVLPWHIVEAYMKTAALPSAVLDFGTIVLLGLALYQERRRIEALQSKRIYKLVVDALPDCLNVKDLQGRFILANPATADLMQAEETKALIGKSDFDFYPEAVAREFKQVDMAALMAGKSINIEQSFTRADGVDTWLSSMKTPLTDYHGDVVGLITHNRDITRRKELESELAQSRAQLSYALTHMADGLVLYDSSRRLLLCNEQYRSMFPKTAHLRVPGAMQRDILRAAAETGEIVMPADRIEAWIEDIVDANRVGNQQIQLGDGRWLDVRARPTDDGGRLSVFSDITSAKTAESELLAANEKLNHLAHRDGLTDLSTRRAFDDAIEREFSRSRRSGSPLSLLLIDVDFFKLYNDQYGHPAGDECLRIVSRCIETTARRPSDLAARYGGEEFAVILPDTDARGAFVIAEALKSAVRALKVPHEASQKKHLTVSIGVSTFDGDGAASVGQLVRRADEALYGAKAAGRDRVHGWRPYAGHDVAMAQGG
jgi:diguanylate cyclase (GGDEF)-like protein/PAS domain S-box-containing protein